MWYRIGPDETQPTPLARMVRIAWTPLEWAWRVPLWVWALVLGIGSLVAALVFAWGWSDSPMPGRRLFARCSVAAIILGLLGAAKDPENWRGGMTASVIGGLGMVAWSMMQFLFDSLFGK